MAEHFVFLTGHLAKPRLERLLTGLGETEFSWEIVDIGVKVAALMTEDIIKRRLKLTSQTDQILLPGRYRRRLLTGSPNISASCSSAAPMKSPISPFFSAEPGSRRIYPVTTCVSLPRLSTRRRFPWKLCSPERER